MQYVTVLTWGLQTYSGVCMWNILYGKTTSKNTTKNEKKREKKQEHTHTHTKRKHVSSARAQNALIRSPGKIPATKLARVARARSRSKN